MGSKPIRESANGCRKQDVWLETRCKYCKRKAKIRHDMDGLPDIHKKPYVWVCENCLTAKPIREIDD